MAIIPSSLSSCCCYDMPWDVILNILCLLPVASLLRFRTVSKRWRNLIDSKDFSKQHLMKSNAYMKLIILDVFSNMLFSIDLSTGKKRNLISLNSHIPADQPFQLFPAYGVRLVGSCNGLLCVRNRDRTFLFNPSTMRYQYMPWIPYISSTILGFGYDAVNDDYKLVMLLPASNSFPISRYMVLVYSLKSNSWRALEEVMNYELSDLNTGTFVGGALHWVPIARSKPHKIIAFDVETEEFREVSTPKIEHTNLSLCGTDVLEGNLCFVSDYSIRLHFVDIWVMKEYGVESSWTKLISISDCEMEPVQPLAYSKCRKHLLVQKGVELNARWYDLENKDNSYVEHHLEMPLIQSYALVDSLLHLNHIINTRARGAPKRKRELLH